MRYVARKGIVGEKVKLHTAHISKGVKTHCSSLESAYLELHNTPPSEQSNKKTNHQLGFIWHVLTDLSESTRVQRNISDLAENEAQYTDGEGRTEVPAQRAAKPSPQRKS